MTNGYLGIPFPKKIWNSLSTKTQKEILKAFEQKNLEEINWRSGMGSFAKVVEMKLNTLDDYELLEIKDFLIKVTQNKMLKKRNDELESEIKELKEFKESLKTVKKALGDL